MLEYKENSINYLLRRNMVERSQIAKANPERGITVTNSSGVYQLYAWHVPSGELRQLTDRAEGVSFGFIAPDGKYVYYHHDEKGNENGKHRHGRCCSHSLSTCYHTRQSGNTSRRLAGMCCHVMRSTDEGYMPDRWNAYSLESSEPT